MPTTTVTDFIAMFVPLAMSATDEEMGVKGTGMVVPAFEFEGFVREESLVTEIPTGHGIVIVEPCRAAQRFDTRAEAEAFVESQTVRRSGWMVLPRTRQITTD